MTSKINTDLPEFETLKRFLSEEREAYKKHYNIENSEGMRTIEGADSILTWLENFNLFTSFLRKPFTPLFF